MLLWAEEEARFGRRSTALIQKSKEKMTFPLSAYWLLAHSYFLLLKVWLITTVCLVGFGLIAHDKIKL